MLIAIVEFLISWLILPQLLQLALPYLLAAIGVPGAEHTFFPQVANIAVTILLLFWRRFLGLGFLFYDITSNVNVLGFLRDLWP